MLALAVPSLSSVAASAASRPVEQLLPGVVSGTGNDGRTITVRDLLQHTSGLSDYIYDVFPGPSAQTYFANRWRAYQPEELVALALRHGPDFPAGTRWAYSNTNYVLAGMIIEKITGRTWEQQVHDRILRPLRLQHTDTPGTKPFLPHPHAANYQQFALDGPMVDTTIPYRPFDSGADGSMTGTARDLNRFFTALANGRLLRPAEFAAMRPTVAVPQDSGHPAGTRDGLGLFFTPVLRRRLPRAWRKRLRICHPDRDNHRRPTYCHRLRAQPLRGPADRCPSGRRTAQPHRPRSVPHHMTTMHSTPRSGRSCPTRGCAALFMSSGRPWAMCRLRVDVRSRDV